MMTPFFQNLPIWLSEAETDKETEGQTALIRFNLPYDLKSSGGPSEREKSSLRRNLRV